MFDQSKYDKTLPKSINDRRQQDCHYLSYQNYISTSDFNKFRAKKLNKPIPKCQKMSKLELQLKIKYRELTNRAKLKILFQEELTAYNAEIEARKPTEDQIMAQNEIFVQEIQQKKEMEKQIQNEKKYLQQLEENCDEIRTLKQELNANAARLVLDYQTDFKKKILEQDKAESMKIDQLAIDDYKAFQRENAENLVQKRLRIKRNYEEMQKEVEIRIQIEIQKKAEKLIEDQKEVELNQQHKVIEMLQKDQLMQEKLLNRRNLECLIQIDKIKKERFLAEQVKEERTQIEEINEEIRLQAVEELRQKELLRDEQAVYLELINYRKSVVDKENETVDQYYFEQIKTGRQAEIDRNQREKGRERKISQICFEYNVNMQKEQKLKENDIIEQKRMDKMKHLAEIQELEEERLIDYQNKVDQQREYVLFLNMQNQQREEKYIEEKQQDKIDFKQTQDKLAQQKKVEEQLIKKVQNQIKEVQECFQPGETFRGKIKRRQWYNM